ncbi:hypothetical protein FHL15_007890 [Xylaria flabelliformis]|uniref:C2H2-type domain-containing protein n=1 Tax=Xylaria flabelliformis TaxID=2512241 RepID=A0A553HTK8_9PEZI|nr:hypothetical protein FHL15_007890 [Xylaria flabelliformis]
MDVPEPTPIASEDAHVANMPSRLISQCFDDSLFFSEQFGDELPAQLNNQIGLEQHEMEWLLQSENNIDMSFHGFSSEQIETQTQSQKLPPMSDVLEPWTSSMDLSCFYDEAPELLSSAKPNNDLLIDTPNVAGHPTSFQPSSASLPRHNREYPTRHPPTRSRSLPPFFTLDSICPYTHTPSASHDRLSLEALVSTRQSAASRSGSQDKRKRPEAIYGHRDRLQSYVDATKLEFIKIWVADVVQHTVYPFEADDMPSGVEAFSDLADRENIDPSYIIRESPKSVETSAPEDLGHDHAFRLATQDIQRRTRISSASFDAMSSANSSASSATSASSYMSFGPRKGRRVAFQETQKLTNDASLSDASSAAWSGESHPTSSIVPQKRKATSDYDSDFATGLDENVSIPNTILEKGKASELSSGEGDRYSSTRAIRYPCTFCYKEFSAPYLWKRHEATAHAPQFQWDYYLSSSGVRNSERQYEMVLFVNCL